MFGSSGSMRKGGRKGGKKGDTTSDFGRFSLTPERAIV
jgi:hypothetical protein